MSDENMAVESVEETPVESAVEETTEEVVEDAVEESSEEVSEDSGEAVEVQAETEEELEQELQEAADAGASKEELTNMVRQFTLKVNNKEYVKEIDLSDEEAVKRELQLALAGRHAMQKASELEKSYNSDIERLKEDPFGVLSELGLDPLALSAAQIEKYLEENEKSPEQKEAEKRQQEYQKMKEENERLRKENEERVRAAKMAEVETEMENEIISSLEADSELVVSPEVIKMVADNMLWAMNNGWDDVGASDVLPTVKKEIQNKYRSYAKSMKSPAALKAALGDDILEQLRQERIEKIKKSPQTLESIKSTSKKVEKKVDEAPKKKVSLSDFMNGR